MAIGKGNNDKPKSARAAAGREQSRRHSSSDRRSGTPRRAATAPKSNGFRKGTG